MGSTRVKNVTIVSFATVIIPHLIVMKIVARMTSMKDSLLVPSGVLTLYGMIEQIKPIHQKN